MYTLYNIYICTFAPLPPPAPLPIVHHEHRRQFGSLAGIFALSKRKERKKGELFGVSLYFSLITDVSDRCDMLFAETSVGIGDESSFSQFARSRCLTEYFVFL